VLLGTGILLLPGQTEDGYIMKNIEEIRKIKKRAEKELLKLPGVVGVDVGYKYIGGKKTDALAIRVLVKNKKDITGENAVPKEIKGIPTDVIERTIELKSDNKD
jgi:hypothetical protein